MSLLASELYVKILVHHSHGAWGSVRTVREQLADGTLVSEVRHLIDTGAAERLRWIRANTRAAMIANLIGHYPIGLALGLVLCFGFKFGVVGIWTGLAAGLISVAAILVRSWVRMTKDLSRLTPIF